MFLLYIFCEYISTSVFTTEVKAELIKIYYSIKKYIICRSKTQASSKTMEKPPMWAGETAMSYFPIGLPLQYRQS